MGMAMPPGGQSTDLRPKVAENTPPNEPLSLPTIGRAAGPQASVRATHVSGVAGVGMTTPLGSTIDDIANTPASQQLPPPSSEGCGVASVPMASVSGLSDGELQHPLRGAAIDAAPGGGKEFGVAPPLQSYRPMQQQQQLSPFELHCNQLLESIAIMAQASRTDREFTLRLGAAFTPGSSSLPVDDRELDALFEHDDNCTPISDFNIVCIHLQSPMLTCCLLVYGHTSMLHFIRLRRLIRRLRRNVRFWK